MPKRMSKTMAAEIADRTLEVVNPQNRGLTLAATLKRHGFVPQTPDQADLLTDRKALIEWLQTQFTG